MAELLRAGLYRLRRSRVLWIVLAALVLLTVGQLLWQWSSYRESGASPETARELELEEGHMESLVFTTAAYGVLLSSAVCAWELGAEYQDGALRLKLIVGRKRRYVYLASLLLTVLVCVLLCLAVFLSGTVTLLLTAGDFTMGWDRALLKMTWTAAVAAAFASLFTLLCLTVSHRAASSIAAIVLTLVLVLVGGSLAGRLAEKPFFDGYTLTVNGELTPVERPNPEYIPQGPLRDVLTFLTDFNPGAQLSSYAHKAVPGPLRLMAYDALFFVLMSAAGILIFQRKELR